jgi:hypothetical protein
MSEQLELEFELLANYLGLDFYCSDGKFWIVKDEDILWQPNQDWNQLMQIFKNLTELFGEFKLTQLDSFLWRAVFSGFDDNTYKWISIRDMFDKTGYIEIEASSYTPQQAIYDLCLKIILLMNEL